MKNTQRLGSVLANRMKKSSDAAVPIVLELGTINGNLSLTPDSLPTTIPKGAYMVNIMLAGSLYRTGTDAHAHTGVDHSHADGTHSHAMPAWFRSLQAGDRVLVAWCGNNPVVIAIVTSS